MKTELTRLYKNKTAFCAAVGISPQYLTQIERGIRPWPPKAVMKLNELHGVPMHELRPYIYPHPDDGLPEHLRGRKKEEAA